MINKLKVPTKTIRIPKIAVFLVFGVLIIAIISFGLDALSPEQPKKAVLEDIQIIQFDKPAQGQDILIIDTTAGTMKAVLYSEQCPNTATLIKQAVADGAYKDLPVSQIEKDLLFICNSRNKEGTTIVNEYHKDLWPFRGSICTISGQDGYSSESLVFLDTIEYTDEMKATFEDSANLQVVGDAFLEHGGVPNFSQQYTVIAQIYDGLDVLDAITAAQYDEETGVPTEEILIKDITVSTYGSEN